MMNRLLSKVVLVAVVFLCAIGYRGVARADAVPYDVSGLWLFRGLDMQRSFCTGALETERMDFIIEIVQNDDDLLIIFPDEDDDQVFVGRTSNFTVAAESNDAFQVSVLSGMLSQDRQKITGMLVFLDRHECPDAESGSTTFMMLRLPGV